MYGMAVHVAQGQGVDFGVVCFHWPNGFGCLIFKRIVFDLCVNSSEYFRMHNISLESMFHWLSKNVLKFEVNVGVYK